MREEREDGASSSACSPLRGAHYSSLHVVLAPLLTPHQHRYLHRKGRASSASPAARSGVHTCAFITPSHSCCILNHQIHTSAFIHSTKLRCFSISRWASIWKRCFWNPLRWRCCVWALWAQKQPPPGLVPPPPPSEPVFSQRLSSSPHLLHESFSSGSV